MFKRSLLIVLSLTISMASAAVYRVMAEEEPVQTVKYDETAPYITILKEVGVLQAGEDGYSDLDHELRRVEFAGLICKMFDFDVDDEESVIRYVNDTGIMVGNGDDFGSNDAITFYEAVAAMVKALGYDIYAQRNGGYPDGYLKKASEAELFKNLEAVSADEPLSRGYAARLIFNTMRADMPVSKIAVELDLTPEEGKTIFSEFHSVYEKTGQITANEHTVIYGIRTTGKNKVAVLDEVYDAGNTDISERIGYTVNIIYKDEDRGSDSRILAYEMVKNKNYEITIDSEDIEAVDSDYIKYYSGKSLKRVKNNVNILIYNGKTANVDYGLMIPENGSLTLLGSESGVFNIAIVHDIKTYVVYGVATDKHMVFDILGKPALLMDDKDKDISIRFSDSNSPLSIDALKENDVLDVEQSADGSVIKAVIYRDYFYRGIIGGQTADDEYIIDGYNVKMSNCYIEALRKANSNLTAVVLGKTYKVLLNGRNEVAYISDSDDKTKGYGYLLQMTVDEDEEDLVHVKIFNSMGKVDALQLAQKVTFNGLSGRAPKYVVDELGGSANVVQQMVYYQTNAKGYISILDTAVEGYDKDRFSRDYSSDMDETRQLEYYSRTFGHRYTLKSGGVIFQKNPDKTGVRLTERDIKVIKLNDIPTQKPYYADIYDSELSGEASMIVITREVHESLDEETAGYLVISGMGRGLDSDDELHDYITGSTESEQNVTLYLSDDVQMAEQEAEVIANETHPYRYYHSISDVTELRRGDVIRYTTNAYGQINVYAPMFLSPAGHPELTYTPDEYIDTQSSHYAAGWTSWCHMYDVSMDYISFRSTRVAAPNSNGEKVNSVFINDSRTPVYMYNSKTKVLSKITYNDIVTLKRSEAEADDMLIRVYQGTVKFVVIYR